MKGEFKKSDYRFKEIVASSKGRQDVIDEMLKAARSVEAEWKVGLESGDQVEIEEQNAKLESSNGVVIRAIFADARAAYAEIAEYLQSELIRLSNIPTLAALNAGRDIAIKFSAFPMASISYALTNIGAVTKQFTDLIVKLSAAAKALLTDCPVELDELEENCKAFISYVNLEEYFKPQLYDYGMNLDMESLRSGDAFIRAADLAKAIRAYTETGLKLSEKIKLLGQRFAEPAKLTEFALMSLDSRRGFFILCNTIRNMTPAIMAFARNVVCTVRYATENYNSIRRALEEVE